MALSGSRVHSLANLSVYCLVENFHSLCNQKLEALPKTVKAQVVKLLCKRGLLNGNNLSIFLDSSLLELDLSECEIDDKALSLIATRCPRLLKIDLNNVKGQRRDLSSDGVQKLASGCHWLRTVYLRRCARVCDRSVTSLARNCQGLTQLNVSGCELVTDEGMREIGENCRQLAHFNFSATSVSDRGVELATSGRCSAALKEIHMNGCQCLTDAAVESAVVNCPNLQILIFHGCPAMTEKTQILLERFSGTRAAKQVTWTIY